MAAATNVPADGGAFDLGFVVQITICGDSYGFTSMSESYPLAKSWGYVSHRTSRIAVGGGLV